MGERGISFINTCSLCGKKYKVQEMETGPWSWQQADIICPHCKKISTKKSSGTFKTFALEEDYK